MGLETYSVAFSHFDAVYILICGRQSIIGLEWSTKYNEIPNKIGKYTTAPPKPESFTDFVQIRV